MRVKRVLFIVGLLMLLAIVCSCANSATYSAVDESDIDWVYYNERAAEFIEAASRGDYDEAEKMFSPDMVLGFGADGLKDAWEQMISATGEYIGIYDILNDTSDGYFVSGVIMQLENSGFAWNVVFSKDGTIEGLWSGGTIALRDLTIES